MREKLSDAQNIESTVGGTEHLDPRFQEFTQLKSLSRLTFFSLLRLPPSLELSFREYYRSKAAATVRYSVYGLIGLYLLVVLPVSFLINDSDKDIWRLFAVYPIGIALLIIWVSTQLPPLNRYVEFTLRFGVFLSLSGTIYATLALGNTLLGQVAGCETIYVLIVGFSLLMLRILAVLGSAIAAFAVAGLTAHFTNHPISWVSMFLYFLVPLLICAITGYLLEYASRRDFIHRLIQQQDKLRMVNDMTALVNDVDDIEAVLAMALGRVCAHTHWTAGRVLSLENTDLKLSARYIESEIADDTLLNIEQIWRSSPPNWVKQVEISGTAHWQDCNILSLDALDKLHTPKMRLIFPVKLDNQVMAVLEFFSMHQEKPDERLLSLMENIGYQLGRVIERKRQQQDLKAKALHDVLTGLPNRAYLFDRLRTNIARAKRDARDGFCVLFIDVDRFKWINDSLGHLVGDRMLVELSKRLQHGIQAADFVARLGGDEFAILIEGIEDEAQAITAMERINLQLERPISLNDHEIHPGLSIGIAMYAAHYTEPEELLRDADIAMYHAKQNGRGTFSIFAHEMHERAVERLKMVADLRHAIALKQFILHYQPIVCTSNGSVVGFEALIRWQHPERGMLPPGLFIPLAEETGLIVPLTEWILEQACQQLSIWQHQLGHKTTSISVNLCASYLTQHDMPDQILAIINAANIDPSTLHLEITETQIVDNADICMTNINRLREASVEIYIDDFGTGYSSLNYLANFRVNTLKIDKSFVQNSSESDKDAHIIRVITSLSHHLGMTVIAEGVETIEQMKLLQAIGCNFAQGFFLSKPVALEFANQMIGKKFNISGLDTVEVSL